MVRGWERAAHHGGVILRKRSGSVGETGEVGVNRGHRLHPVMEKFGVFVIRDLQGTSLGVRR